MTSGRPVTPLGTISLPVFGLPDEESIAARVKGDSMTGDAIRGGDYILIAPGRELVNGDIAVVLYTTEKGIRVYVVKHVRRQGDDLILESSNPAYPPVTVTPDADPVIVGVVVGVVRHLE